MSWTELVGLWMMSGLHPIWRLWPLPVPAAGDREGHGLQMGVAGVGQLTAQPKDQCKCWCLGASVFLASDRCRGEPTGTKLGMGTAAVLRALGSYLDVFSAHSNNGYMWRSVSSKRSNICPQQQQ
jgi:hypothetical protein